MCSFERRGIVTLLLLSAALAACEGTSAPEGFWPEPPPERETRISDEQLCQFALGKTHHSEVEQRLGPPGLGGGGTECVAGKSHLRLQYSFDVDSQGAPESGAIFFDFGSDGTLVRVSLMRELSRNTTPLPLCLRASAPPGFDPELAMVCAGDGGVGGDAGADL